MRKFARALSCLLLYVLFLAAGCSVHPEIGQWQGPESPADSTVAEWTFGEDPAKVLESRHYRIYTTITDEEVLRKLPQVMEGALGMYRLLAPEVHGAQRPMECYLFRWRSEWHQYTQRHTGTDARIYLQIRSGGYTVYDRYVAYYIGEEATFSVAAHEGWHQFAGRHFKGRLPPFLEEGMACLFETISWSDGLPRWNLSVNPVRAQSLRKALDADQLWSLEKLCAMHAGDIVGEPNDRIDAFYAQSWAFARFLWEAEDQKYRPALQKWIAETANGTVHDPTRTHVRALSPWNRRGVKPMIEHYLSMDINAVDSAFKAYMRKIAYEELGSQRKSAP